MTSWSKQPIALSFSLIEMKTGNPFDEKYTYGVRELKRNTHVNAFACTIKKYLENRKKE